MKKKLFILSIIVIAVISLSITAMAAVSSWKSEADKNIPNNSAYGSSYDNSPNKELNKTFVFNSVSLNLKYVRTDELKDLSVDKRSDSYGTFDVYCDENNTEYLFLLNTDLFCGMKLDNIGQATPKANAISVDKANDIANSFLTKNVAEISKYKMFSCVYDELSGIYDIQYYKPINNYKSDDIVRIWVKANGEIGSFSAFNMNRYADISINSDSLKSADDKLNNNIATSLGSSKYTLVDSYLTMDDSGNMVLAYVIDYRISQGETYYTERNIFTQKIN